MSVSPAASQVEPAGPVDDAVTPTRSTFNNNAHILVSQKPLPSSPFPDSVQMPGTAGGNSPNRENALSRARKSRESEDIDMYGGSDGEGTNHDDAVPSDDESVGGDGSKSNKKKKSQRFYCTDYPPCNLSFTRSEHLARHIRKHTGERPFQCHCSRRFSRLDNLRQHAQTVHVNEDIPMDSLAATGTRFQRQIRTDRVRQAGARARASTSGNIGPPSRGHSKSLSTSSIASVSSIGSNYSVNEMRRRPPPLATNADPRSRMPIESYRPPLDAHLYRQPSPSDFSTPTSATFSAGQGSPRWGSGVVSPTSSHSRSHSMYAGPRTPGRRLSVPSGGNPFYSPHGINVGRPIFASGAVGSTNHSTIPSAGSSLLASPTGPHPSYSRRDSTSSATDEAWRRRTWHPDTRESNNGSSRLSQMVTPSQLASSSVPLPIATPGQHPPQPALRLPGIESFDPLPPHPTTPSRRAPSPMMIDSESPTRRPLLPAAEVISEDRRNPNTHWDMGLHRGLTKLDINTPPRDTAGAWAAEANQALLSHSEQNRQGFAQQPSVRFEAEATVARSHFNPAPAPSGRHQHTMSAPSVNAPREAKRHGWYHGPPNLHPAEETIPEGRPHVDRIIHPNVNEFQGFPAREPLPPPSMQPAGPPQEQRNMNGESMDRLKALVAVATSESSTATAC